MFHMRIPIAFLIYCCLFAGLLCSTVFAVTPIYLFSNTMPGFVNQGEYVNGAGCCAYMCDKDWRQSQRGFNASCNIGCNNILNTYSTYAGAFHPVPLSTASYQYACIRPDQLDPSVSNGTLASFLVFYRLCNNINITPSPACFKDLNNVKMNADAVVQF